MIIEAILKINKNAQVNVSGSNLDTCTIEWLNGTVEISKSDIQAKINKTQYQRDRVYPSIGDQLDLLFHSIDNDAELKSKYFDFHQAILAVKAKHPK